MGFFDLLKQRREAGALPQGASAGFSAEPSIVTVSHHGSSIGLRPEFEERYLILHRNVFPGVLRRIRESNIRNYSIFLGGGRLFSHFEYIGKDFAGDMAAMGDPITKEWWKLTDPMQKPLREKGEGEWWATAAHLGQFGGDVRTGRGVVRGCIRAAAGVRAVERVRKIVETHRQAIAPILRKHGFQNAGVYHVGGWVHCYYEFSGENPLPAGAAFAHEPEIQAVADEFRSVVQPGEKKGRGGLWEPMAEVFHTD
jgi:L-rhamnose mutarotase